MTGIKVAMVHKVCLCEIVKNNRVRVKERALRDCMKGMRYRDNALCCEQRH